MSSKLTLSMVLACLIAPSIVNSKEGDARVEYSSHEYLKNFALSVCISHAYDSEDVTKDSLAAAGGYFNLGSFPIEAYEQVDTLSKSFLAKEYHGIHGEKLILMKCVDFFYSKELEQIIKQYDRK